MIKFNPKKIAKRLSELNWDQTDLAVRMKKEGQTKESAQTYVNGVSLTVLNGLRESSGGGLRHLRGSKEKQRKRSDNPVHDILGDRLRIPDLKSYCF
jgi:hypothetical protein